MRLQVTFTAHAHSIATTSTFGSTKVDNSTSASMITAVWRASFKAYEIKVAELMLDVATHSPGS